MSGRRPLLAAAALAGALLAGAAAAEPSKFTWGDVIVIDSKAFLSSAPQPVRLNTNFELTLQNTNEAKAFANNGFQMRWFRADKAWNPVPYERGQQIPYRHFPPCEVYLSSRWLDVRRSNNSLMLDKLDAGWLDAGPGGKLVDGHWLVVFESRANDHDVLRLSETESARYFSYAARVVVETGGDSYTYASLPPLSSSDAEALKALRAEGIVNAPSRDCMRVKKVADIAPTVMASLESCMVEAAP